MLRRACLCGLALAAGLPLVPNPALASRLFIESARVNLAADTAIFPLRRGVTAAGETPHGTPLTLRLEDDWLFYADRTYDLPHENAEGPCAALFLTPPTQVRCDNGNYVVQTDADYPEGTKDLSLILWDFHGQKNADALAAMEGLVARAKGR